MRLFLSSRWMLAGLGLLITLANGCDRPANAENAPLLIAGAANLRFALEELTADFSAQTGIPTEITLASSGKLTAQIKAGAPYDVFLAADEQYPAALATAGLTLAPPKPYARGALALWTTTRSIDLDASTLDAADIRKIAIPHPATAPYGAAAMEYLRQQGLDSILAPKLVFGESVGQANQFVFSGAAEVGITALATMGSLEDYHAYRRLEAAPLVQQTGVVLQSSNQPTAAIAFLDYLFSPQGQLTLQKFGYFTAE